MKSLLAVFLISVALASAQANKSTLPPGTVTIDGKATPTAITDAMALRMFYVTSAPKSAVSSAATPKVLEDFFRGLTADADKATILGRVRNWQAAAPAGVPAKSFAQLDALIDSDLDTLKKGLSGQGWSALKANLDRLKTTMKIYEVPAPKGKK